MRRLIVTISAVVGGVLAFASVASAILVWSAGTGIVVGDVPLSGGFHLYRTDTISFLPARVEAHDEFAIAIVSDSESVKAPGPCTPGVIQDGETELPQTNWVLYRVTPGGPTSYDVPRPPVVGVLTPDGTRTVFQELVCDGEIRAREIHTLTLPVPAGLDAGCYQTTAFNPQHLTNWSGSVATLAVGDVDCALGGRIIIEKQTLPDGALDAFTFSGQISTELHDGEETSAAVGAGTYVVTEAAKPGWGVSSIVCSDSDSTGNTTTRTATLQVADGEVVRCIFTNAAEVRLTLRSSYSGTLGIANASAVGTDTAMASGGGAQAVGRVCITSTWSVTMNIRSASTVEMQWNGQPAEFWNFQDIDRTKPNGLGFFTNPLYTESVVWTACSEGSTISIPARPGAQGGPGGGLLMTGTGSFVHLKHTATAFAYGTDGGLLGSLDIGQTVNKPLFSWCKQVSAVIWPSTGPLTKSGC